MATLAIEKALAYLDTLEADRQSALALSQQKAEDAKLIKARQEVFRAAMEILCAGSERPTVPATDLRSDRKEPHRRGRRPIRELILRELSFSGQPMTTAQVAKAIEYLPDRTETALERMESTGQVLRNREGRWVIVTTKTNGHAATAGSGNPLDPPQRAAEVLQDQAC